jgi:lambda family phage minor tail protein L
MPINNTVHQSTVSSYITLIQIDCTNIPAINQIFYISPSGTESTTIEFNGHTYSPFPAQITGEGVTASDAPKRPQLALSNVNNLFGVLAFDYSDLAGCRVTHIITFSEYLGIGSSISKAPTKYEIRKKLSQDVATLSFELGSLTDRERSYLPRKIMLKTETTAPYTLYCPALGLNKVLKQ